MAGCIPPAAAQFFVVDTTADTVDVNPGDGVCADSGGNCSLRAAVMEANADPNTTEIQLTGGTTYTLTIAGAGEDSSASGDLDLLERTYIRSAIGSGQATIDGGGLDRVIDIVSGHYHFLEGLDITGGNSLIVGDDGHGGGVLARTGLVGIEDRGEDRTQRRKGADHGLELVLHIRGVGATCPLRDANQFGGGAAPQLLTDRARKGDPARAL